MFYYIYLRRYVLKPWNVKVDRSFEPEISILIPTHNEEANIEEKLENIKSISYPKRKIEIIVADDCSNDGTVHKINSFMQKNPDLNIKLVTQSQRIGKSAALNKALNVASKSIIIVSDADTKWPHDILQKALPFLADPNIGAITGRGMNVNFEESWITKAEETYLKLANFIRLGESKIHSTIRFEGGFCAYKRSGFDVFDYVTGCDDSGTALKIVQNGFRTIMVPEVVFYTKFPIFLRYKLIIKVRRANQLIRLWVKCLKLMIKRKLLLPKKIVIPEIMLFVLNPIVSIILILTALISILMFPLSTFSISIIIFIAILLILARNIFVEVLLDNIILLCALVTFLLGRRYIKW